MSIHIYIFHRIRHSHTVMSKKSGNETKNLQLKAFIHPSLKKEMDAFVEGQKIVTTQTDLVEFAVRFYIESFKKSGGLVNQERFPMLSAAGEITMTEKQARDGTKQEKRPKAVGH